MYGTGIGTSLILIATGAILAMAVEYQVSGLDINAVGVILIVVGLIGLVLSLAFLGGFDMFGPRTSDRVHEAPAATHTHEREVVHEVERPVSETTTTRTTRRL